MAEQNDLFPKNAETMLKRLGFSVDKLKSADFDADSAFDEWKPEFLKVSASDEIAAARKVGKTAGYIDAQKKIKSMFGVDGENLDDMLEAIKEAKQNLKDTNADPNATKAEKADAANQLKELQTMLQTANTKLKEYEAQVKDLPAQLDAAKKEGYKGAKKESVLLMELQKAAQYAAEKSAYADPAFLQYTLQQKGYDIDIDDAGAIVMQKQQDGTFTPLKKTGTEFYRSLSDFMAEKIIPADMKRAAPAVPNGYTPTNNPNIPPVAKSDVIQNPAFAKWAQSK